MRIPKSPMRSRAVFEARICRRDAWAYSCPGMWLLTPVQSAERTPGRTLPWETAGGRIWRTCARAARRIPRRTSRHLVLVPALRAPHGSHRGQRLAPFATVASHVIGNKAHLPCAAVLATAGRPPTANRAAAASPRPPFPVALPAAPGPLHESYRQAAMPASRPPQGCSANVRS
jgi:hypothetical protein